MALFTRKNNTVQTQIPELQEYYATQKKESTALAWLLAIGSLLVTVAVFVGLFAGGRWIYRNLTKNDDTTTTQTQDQNKPNDTTNTATTQPSQPTPNSTNNSATINSGTVTIGQGSSAAPSPGVSPKQSAQTNSSAVAANTNIPNTGPGSVVVIFAVTTLAGTMLYRRKLIKNN